MRRVRGARARVGGGEAMRASRRSSSRRGFDVTRDLGDDVRGLCARGGGRCVTLTSLRDLRAIRTARTALMDRTRMIFESSGT